MFTYPIYYHKSVTLVETYMHFLSVMSGKGNNVRQTEFTLDRTKSVSFDWTDFERVFASGNCLVVSDKYPVVSKTFMPNSASILTFDIYKLV